MHHTANAMKLSTTIPATTLIATAPPVLRPLLLVAFELGGTVGLELVAFGTFDGGLGI